ncbi:MAG: glycosyltransferase family 4 protein [Phycisphaerales bacterium]|nr:MAG: glycosyltransferase family 4 protein [Phycisphaerales bacterium]
MLPRVMQVWLVNPFDPCPGGAEQLGRYAHLVHALRDAGHGVVWWSSTFSHRFKSDVDAESLQRQAASWGFDLRLIPTPPYRSNVSVGRLWSHVVYARRFRALAESLERPDLILASSPPLEVAGEAALLGRRWNVPAIIDIQDRWPDAFVRVLPKAARGLSRGLLLPWYRAERRAYRAADGIIGVARGYVERGLAVGGEKRYRGVFPIGVHLGDVDEAIARGAQSHADRWTKPDDRIWMVYSGSLTRNYDFLTVIRAAALSRQRFGGRLRFLITGQGHLAEKARRIIRRESLDNVDMCGFLGFEEWAYLVSQADAGFNVSFPDALIYMPNKVFFYMAARLALLNTIPGQCAELIAKHDCGVNYKAGDVDACFASIRGLVEAPDDLRRMQAASRRLAETAFDRRIIDREFVRFLRDVAEDYRDVRSGEPSRFTRDQRSAEFALWE